MFPFILMHPRQPQSAVISFKKKNHQTFQSCFFTFFLQISQKRRLFSFIDPRHVLSSEKCRFQQGTPFDDDFNMGFSGRKSIFKSRFLPFFVQISQKGRLYPFILTLDNPEPLSSHFFWKVPNFNSVPDLTTILTWASMGENYMINVCWPLKVAQFGQKSWRRLSHWNNGEGSRTACWCWSIQSAQPSAGATGTTEDGLWTVYVACL